MKVLMVAPYFEPAVGGVENYLLQIIRRLSDRWEVVVATAGLDGRESVRVDDRYGYRVVALPVGARIFNTPLSADWPRRLGGLIRSERPDVVNAHMPVPGMADVAARVHGDVPFVLTYYNDVVKEGFASGVARGYYALAGNGTIRRARRLICMSPEYVAQSPYLDESTLTIDMVPPGVDTERMVPSGPEVSDPVVLFVANLDLTHFHKGLDVLLRALAQVVPRVPGARLVVVGRGDGEAVYRRQAEELGLSGRVEFRGFVSDDDLPAAYRAARVTVLPSTNAAEGFGMVLLESQACGTPVIGTRAGGIPAAVAEGVSGLLVDPGSVDQLAGALADVLGSEPVYRQLRSGCRPFALRFSWEEAARRTEDCYRRAMGAEIVEVSALYPPELGGLEQVCARYAEGLAARGRPVTVLTSSSSSTARTPPSAGSRAGAPRIVRRRRFDVGGLPVIPGLYRLLRRVSPPAVLHVHLSQAGIPEMALLAARRRHVPVVIHFHLDVASSGRFGYLFDLYKRHVLPRSLRAADRVVCFSPEQRDFLGSRYGVPPDRVRIVENGVEALTVAARPRTFTPPLRLLFVGRLAPQKRVDVLIDTMAALASDPRFSASVVGSGPLGADLRRRAAGLANVEFAGRLDGDDLIAAFRAADVFVLPSEREGMPLALLEAMSAGLAVVASDAPGIRDFVQPGRTGLLFPAGSVEGLAGALRSLADDPERAGEVASAGARYAGGLSWDLAFDRMEEVLAEVT